MIDRRTKLTNAELMAVYRCLKGELTHTELAESLGKTRTNGYYYIGRAVTYWLKIGVLRFRRGLTAEDLGGKDMQKQKEGVL